MCRFFVPDQQAAADHFLPLLPIDQLDVWDVVTLDYQACGGVLAESGDRERFGQFCQTVMVNYGTTTNGDLAGRLLKTCLLMSTSTPSLVALKPLGQTAEHFFAPIPASAFPTWATIPMSFWKYRCGDYEQAAVWCQRELDSKDHIPVLDATIRIIYAMTCWQRRDVAEARSQLATGRKVIEETFKAGLPRGNGSDGFWYDWVFAQVVRQEAEGLMAEGEGSSQNSNNQRLVNNPRMASGE